MNYLRLTFALDEKKPERCHKDTARLNLQVDIECQVCKVSKAEIKRERTFEASKIDWNYPTRKSNEICDLQKIRQIRFFFIIETTAVERI